MVVWGFEPLWDVVWFHPLSFFSSFSSAFPFLFFLFFRVLSKRGSLSLFFCVRGCCVMGVPGLNVKSIDRVGSDQERRRLWELTIAKIHLPCWRCEGLSHTHKWAPQGAEFVAAPDSSWQTHLIAARVASVKVTPWRLLLRSWSLLATTLFHCIGPSKARSVHVQTPTADTSCAHDRHAHESLISATYFLSARRPASSCTTRWPTHLQGLGSFDQSVSDHIRCVSIKKCCS